MSILNLFRKNKKPDIIQSDEKINYNYTSDELTKLIREAVFIFHLEKNKGIEGIMDSLDALTTNDVKASNALYNFIPLVLCCKLFPEPEYPDYYLICKNKNNFTEHLLCNNDMYNCVNETVEDMLLSKVLTEDELFSVLAHSATMDALSQALNNGSNLEDLILSPCVFFSEV